AVEEHYDSPPLWLVVSPYTISATKHVLYPNRLLLEAGFVDTNRLSASRAWALTDRQISHVYVREHATASDVVHLFARQPGVAEVLAGDERSRYDLVHE